MIHRHEMILFQTPQRPVLRINPFFSRNISQQKRSFRVLRPADRYMECAVRPVFRKHQAFIQSRRDIQASANRNKQNRPGNCTAHFQLQTADRRRTKGIIFFFRDIGNILVYIIPYQPRIGGKRFLLLSSQHTANVTSVSADFFQPDSGTQQILYMYIFRPAAALC